MNKRAKVYFSCLFGLWLALGASGCGSHKAPTCAEVASQSVERTLESERFGSLPTQVQDSIDDNRDELEKQAATACDQRGWSKRVRRCKYNAASDAEAAACEDPRR